jgi:hypothetical protein
MSAAMAGLFGVASAIGLLYYGLGKLEPNTVRWIATGSICLTPLLAVVALAFGQYVYGTKVRGLRDGMDAARDAFHEVAVGVGKVTQARQARPVTTFTPYPYPVLPPTATGGMIIEQRAVDDDYFAP